MRLSAVEVIGYLAIGALAVTVISVAVMDRAVNSQYVAACEKLGGKALRTLGGHRACLKADVIELQIVVKP